MACFVIRTEHAADDGDWDAGAVWGGAFQHGLVQHGGMLDVNGVNHEAGVIVEAAI
jgi:hypothetical protein